MGQWKFPVLKVVKFHILRSLHPRRTISMFQRKDKINTEQIVPVLICLFYFCFFVWVQRPEEVTRPFPLHPCLVSPDSEMAFLRCVARILLLCLLPQKDAKSHTLRCCLTEVITTKGTDVLQYLYYLEKYIRIKFKKKRIQKKSHWFITVLLLMSDQKSGFNSVVLNSVIEAPLMFI